jgi:hypothetical protein
MVVLDPDVARVFTTAATVNAVLQTLITTPLHVSILTYYGHSRLKTIWTPSIAARSQLYD